MLRATGSCDGGGRGADVMSPFKKKRKRKKETEKKVVAAHSLAT